MTGPITAQAKRRLALAKNNVEWAVLGRRTWGINADFWGWVIATVVLHVGATVGFVASGREYLFLIPLPSALVSLFWYFKSQSCETAERDADREFILATVALEEARELEPTQAEEEEQDEGTTT